MISHRRVRSASNAPSKLSNYISAPLTPHPEESKTPGGTAVLNSPNNGFFSSVFSAAQNAANQLSNSGGAFQNYAGMQALNQNTGVGASQNASVSVAVSTGAA